MKRLLLAAGLVLLTAWMANPCPGQDKKVPKKVPKVEAAAPALEHVIYVPYKELSRVFEKEGRGVFIPYRQFRQIWEKATREKVKKPLPPVPAMVTKATYKLKVGSDVAKGTGTLTIEVLTDDWISLPLNLNRLALTRARLDGGRALLVATQNSYTLVLRGKGEHSLEISFALPLDKSGGGGSFEFGCPEAPVSQLHVDIPQTDIQVEVRPKLVATVKPGEGRTTVLAFVGNTDTVALSWKPRPREALPLAGVFFAKVLNSVHAGDKVLSLTSEIDYEILQELNRLKVRLPGAFRLLGVAGEQIKVWNVQEQGGQRVLTVDLLAQARKGYKLKLTLDREIGEKEKELELPELEVLGATRETGFLSLSLGVELKCKLLESKGVSQVSARELPAAPPYGGPVLVFRYLAHPYVVKVQIDEVKPEIKVENYTRFTITKEFLDLASLLVVDIKKRPVFNLSVIIPEGYAVTEVPDRIVKDFRVKKSDKKRILELDLESVSGGPVAGRVQLVIYLQKKRDDGKIVDLPSTSLVEAQKETGVFGIYLANELKVTTEEKSGLIPVDSSAFAPARSKLRAETGTQFAMALRYHKLPVSAKLKVEPRKTRIDATVETLVSVREEIVKVHSTIRYKVLYAPVRTFSLTLPKSVGEDARVRGANTSSISKKTKDDLTTWTIKLQGNVLGDYELCVDYDIKAKFDTASLRQLVTGELALLDVFQETGHIGIKKTESLSVFSKTAEGLETVDVQELPIALRSRLPYEAYKYVSHPYKLVLSVQKHHLQSVLDTVITRMHLETQISRGGAATTKCLYQIQSKGRQFATFILPLDAVVLKLYVNGKDTRSHLSPKGPHYLVVNLARRTPRSARRTVSHTDEVTVEVVYKQNLAPAGGSSTAPLSTDQKGERRKESGASRMGYYGSFALSAPVSEEQIPTLRTTWAIRLPRGFFYSSFGGNMRRLFSSRSVWIWGKSLILGAEKEADADGGCLREISTARKLFVKDPKLIKIKFSPEGLPFYFVKQEGNAKINFSYFERNFFFTLDVLLLIATVAGMLVAVSYVPYVTKMRLAPTVIAVSLVLATLLADAGSEFFATVFLGAVLVCGYWIIRFFALPPVQRLKAAGRSSTAPLSTDKKGEPQTGEQPPSAAKGGGEDA